MFGLWRRLGEAEARIAALTGEVKRLQELVDLPELERMRASVLNALRAYRRSVTAAEARTDDGQGSTKGDDVDRLLRIRRGS